MVTCGGLIRASQVVLVIKNLPANSEVIRDAGLISGPGRSPGEGNGNSLQYSCLEDPRDRGASCVTVDGGHKESGTMVVTSHAYTRKP